MRTIERQGIRLIVEDGIETSHWNFWGRYMKSWSASILTMIDVMLPDDGKLVDIGAWVGPMTLWAAQRADVVAIEPDPVACSQLRKNVTANGLDDRVTIIEAAASCCNDDLELWAYSKWGRSHSGMTRQQGKSIMVRGINAAHLIEDQKPDLVKMDIEGGEVLVVPVIGEVMRRNGTPLLLSLHPNFYEGFDVQPMESELAAWDKKPVGTTRVNGKEWLYTPR